MLIQQHPVPYNRPLQCYPAWDSSCLWHLHWTRKSRSAFDPRGKQGSVTICDRCQSGLIAAISLEFTHTRVSVSPVSVVQGKRFNRNQTYHVTKCDKESLILMYFLGGTNHKHVILLLCHWARQFLVYLHQRSCGYINS